MIKISLHPDLLRHLGEVTEVPQPRGPLGLGEALRTWREDSWDPACGPCSLHHVPPALECNGKALCPRGLTRDAVLVN